MPAQILHTLFGEDVIAELYKPQYPWFSLFSKSIVERIQRKYWAVFALGCQGPDIFYHSQMTRPAALEYGTLLHRRGFGDFTAALLKRTILNPPADGEDGSPRQREQEISPLGIYTLGFMTHAFLDRLTHPYIVYKSGVVPPTADEAAGFVKRFPRGNAHALFERILDVLMLDLLRGMPVISWDQKALAGVCAEPPLGLRELLVHTMEEVFPERAGGDRRLFQRITNTLRDCALFYRFTDPGYTSLRRRIAATQNPPKVSLAYLYPEQLPLSIDYLNLGRRTWYYPVAGDREDNRSFPEIYQAAVKSAEDTLGGIAPHPETGPFLIKEAARSLGSGGLSIVDETGKPCIPTRAGTLPLDKVIMQQEILRNTIAELSLRTL